jgi:hypothetical protein
MERKTKIAAAVTGAVLLVFLIVLAGDFLLEEQILIFLIPFVPVGSLLAARYVVARFRKRPVTLERRIRRLLYACSLFNCLVIAAYLYCTWPRAYDRADAIEDIDSFVKTLEDVHPNLYDLVPKEEFADSVRTVKRGLLPRVGEHDLYAGLSRLGALVRDGHTGSGFSYLIRRGNLLLRGIFPYAVRVDNDRVYVTGNYSYRDRIPAGSEIVRINGLTNAEFVSGVSAMLSYESLSFRNALVANPMIIAAWNDFKGYVIEYRTAGSTEVRTLTARGGLYARVQYLSGITALGKPYEFRMVTDSIAYIGFYRFDDPERFKVFLRESFTSLRAGGISHLVIDVRENGGGNSYLGDELMQYISRKPFRMFDRVLVKVSDEVLSWHPDRIDSTKRKAGTAYDEILPLSPLEENPLRFSGDCILLTGRNTFSSAAAFASAFRCFDAGVIVGEETGGITVCYGDLYDFTLPRTGLGFRVSWKKFSNACGVDNRRGVLPDYVVEESPLNGGRGVDTVLQFAIELAKTGGTRTAPAGSFRRM